MAFSPSITFSTNASEISLSWDDIETSSHMAGSCYTVENDIMQLHPHIGYNIALQVEASQGSSQEGWLQTWQRQEQL